MKQSTLEAFTETTLLVKSMKIKLTVILPEKKKNQANTVLIIWLYKNKTTMYYMTKTLQKTETAANIIKVRARYIIKDFQKYLRILVP